MSWGGGRAPVQHETVEHNITKQAIAAPPSGRVFTYILRMSHDGKADQHRQEANAASPYAHATSSLVLVFSPFSERHFLFGKVHALSHNTAPGRAAPTVVYADNQSILGATPLGLLVFVV